MRLPQAFRSHLIGFLATSLLLLSSHSAIAVITSDPIEANSAFHFRDTRSLTRSGFFIGDRLAVGVETVTPNPDSGIGGELTNVVARQDSFEFEMEFIGGVFGGQYVNSTAFDPSLTDAWDVVITNSGSTNSPLILTTPAVGTASLVPFVSDGSMIPNGTTPTVRWKKPDSFTPDQIRIFVLDLDLRSADGSALVIHRENLSPGATSFSFPSVLEAGIPLVTGGRYEIAVQMQRLRSDSSTLARSRTFFSFTPIASGPEVALPIVGPDNVFYFNHAVKASTPIVLDPDYAIGFDYAIGLGDPLFQSVRILSDIGDGLYDLYFDVDGTGYHEVLRTGDLFSFLPSGVDAFSIRGIEPSAGLDPRITTGFLTEVTFTTDGRFTGTMTPRTVAEPGLFPMLFFGFFMAGYITLQRVQTTVPTTRSTSPV